MPKLNARSVANSLVILALTIPSTVAFAHQSPGDPPTSTQSSPLDDATAQSGKLLHLGSDRGIVPPHLLNTVQPEFSNEARAKKISGEVIVYLRVDKNGNPFHVQIYRGIGHGLDEKAIEAVRQYKFKPATRKGQPVMVDLYIDVKFQIFPSTKTSIAK